MFVNALGIREINNNKLAIDNKKNTNNQNFCGSFGFGNGALESDVLQLTKEATDGIVERLANISIWQQLQKYFSDKFGDKD